jgi:HlyD family secretion protein
MTKVSAPAPAPEPQPAAARATAKQAVAEAADRWLARNRSLVLRQTPVWAQSLAAIVIGLGVVAVVGGVLFRIDEVVTVSGQLEALTGSTDVKTPAGGKVAAVLFKDGQLVRRGQMLVRFDTRQAADDKSTTSRLIQLERSDLDDKLLILRERQMVLQQKVSTSEQITNELKGLVANGGFQRVQYLQQLDQLLELKSQLASVRLDMNRTRLEAEKSIGQLRNRLKQAELQLQYQNVVAPVTGVVFEPRARVDGVIQAGETILTLVPQQGLKAKVFVANKDIGFVKTGQQAKVRVDAFPFTRYGELQGRVSQIGADALPPDQTANFYRFPVQLTLNRSYLESQGVKIPLRSGMAITANLKLREKRVISLISDLLVDQTESIKGIRQQ